MGICKDMQLQSFLKRPGCGVCVCLNFILTGVEMIIG